MNAKLFAKAQSIFSRFAKERGIEPGVRAEKKDTVGELYIYGPIGADWWDGISAQAVVDRLVELKSGGVKSLNVYINSPGGDVFDGKAIHAAISRFEGQKTVTVDGIAASAATVIAMAGDKIVTSLGATWMIHEASSGAWGRAADLRSIADILELENRNICDIYCSRTKQKAGDVLAWMASETWMDATTALQRGFCDEVLVDLNQEDDGDEKGGAAEANAPRSIASAARATQRVIESCPTRDRIALMEQDLTLDNLRRRASPTALRNGQPERATKSTT